ncbi:hypothetical protein ODJ79_13780 [Actinoplanes sp. KI2]|uniref:hypothetical protein n=1 Tax=Actinoplanes sp. KI2 TaxID=2983315 RepID=UPI0021D5C686|nr:hypothetical protein [Actinoplanes sp. KI2]MCU7724790.1 hypothetical protein [Actinoplanes sp. KI2]
MYLVPPMDDDPPPEFVAFVAGHLTALRRETDRLVGGDPEGAHLYMDVLADVAGHWRRLRAWSWLAHTDAPSAYLQKRLASRTKQWREEQIYEVDVRVLRTQPYVPLHGPGQTLALRKAKVLPDTVRRGAVPQADAGIAWVHACRKEQWHRVGRLVVTGILLVGGIIQYMSWLSTST